jgi:hypothetical protein
MASRSEKVDKAEEPILAFLGCIDWTQLSPKIPAHQQDSNSNIQELPVIQHEEQEAPISAWQPNNLQVFCSIVFAKMSQQNPCSCEWRLRPGEHH